MGGWCRVSTNLWLVFFFFLSSGLRGITCQNPGWSFPRLLPWMLLLLPLLWDRRRGSQETGRSPVGGRVTPRILDAGDLVLGLAMIPGDRVDFHCSLLVPGMGCVCEGAHGHPQIPGCLYLSHSGFLSLSPRCRLIPFPGKIFASCAGEIQWLLAASIRQTGMSWHAGLSVRKTDVSAATEVLQRASPGAQRGRSQQGEWCDQQRLSLTPSSPVLGVIWVSGSKSCSVTLSPGLGQTLEGGK